MKNYLSVNNNIIHPTLNPKTGPSLSNGLSEAGIGFIPANSIKDNEETEDSLRPLLNKQLPTYLPTYLPTDASNLNQIKSGPRSTVVLPL